jgi:hypothetical protein
MAAFFYGNLNCLVNNVASGNLAGIVDGTQGSLLVVNNVRPQKLC